MKKKVEIKKGFTLIELVVALALMGIIICIVFAFVLSNQRQANKIATKSGLQSQAEEVTRNLSKIAMQSVRIERINFEPVTGNVELKVLFDNSDKENLVYKDIIFNKQDKLLKVEGIPYDIKNVECMTLYKVEGSTVTEITRTNLASIKLDKISSLKLKLDFKDKNEKYTIQNEFELRNYKSVADELEEEVELFNKTIRGFDLKNSEFADVKDDTFTIKSKINSDIIKVYTENSKKQNEIQTKFLKVTTKIGVSGVEKTVVIANNLKELTNNRTPGDIKNIKKFKILFTIYGENEEFSRESDEFNLGN